MDKVILAGETPGAGDYRCLKCGYIITIADGEELPICPMCGFEQWSKVD